MTKAIALYRIILRLFSENLVAFCRLVISARRGCFQLPGLSVTAALVAAAFWGVPTGVLTAADLDVIAVDDIAGGSRWLVGGGCRGCCDAVVATLQRQSQFLRNQLAGDSTIGRENTLQTQPRGLDAPVAGLRKRGDYLDAAVRCGLVKLARLPSD